LEYADDFTAFWKIYPEHGRVKKPTAFSAWLKAIKTASVAEIMEAVKIYAESDDVRRGYACHASTFLNQRRWEESPAAWNRRPVGKQPTPTKDFFPTEDEVRSEYKLPQQPRFGSDGNGRGRLVVSNDEDGDGIPF